MNERTQRFWCGVTCWGAAAVIGLVAFVMLLLSGAWGLIQAIWAAGVILLVLGVAFQALFCRPLPPPVSRAAVSMEASGGASGVSPSAPAPAAPVAEPPAEAAPAARRPAAMAAAEGIADDLKRIKGVGPKLEEMLNGMGIYHYRQIAAWGPEEIAWCDDNLEGFKGRVSRDEWVAQAGILAAGGETEFSRRSDGS
jgi:predicted flap endonuclease-1-like 5' DNA nuclease